MNGLDAGRIAGSLRWTASLAIASLLLAVAAQAVVPVAKTVPVVASNPLVPHDAFAGATVRLKGTVSLPYNATVGNFRYTWDFGDGSTSVATAVTDPYNLEALHTYSASAPVGKVFTATLHVTDTTAPADTSSAFYYTEIRASSLQTRVNIAIDEGLWYLHKNMNRSNTASGGADHNPAGIDIGNWYTYTGSHTNNGWISLSATNIQALEVNGHLESGPSTDPYTEDVARALKWMFSNLTTMSITSTKTYPTTGGVITVQPAVPNGMITVNPDTNGNGIAIYSSLESNPGYENGMLMDAIVATGTPNAITHLGPTGVNGRKYLDILQDMVDWYAHCQGNINPYHGGWRYSCLYGYPDSDNSTNQWASVGLSAARRFGATVPSFIISAQHNAIAFSEGGGTAATPPMISNGCPVGEFGYTNSCGTVWGPFAVTPSGLVQLTLDGIGRGDVRWNTAETFMRDNFCNDPGTGAGSAPRAYMYGEFSLTKAMLLHAPGGVLTPIKFLSDQPSGANPIDWYGAQKANGDACDGVAATLLSQQLADGSWFGPSFSSDHWYFTTAWAVIMLNRTVFSAGEPVAVATANPNPAIASETVTLNGAGSFSQDPTKTIVSWQWDLGNNGTFDLTGVNVTTKYTALGSYPVRLHVCDNGSPASCADTVITVVVATPPLPPTANAGGPYNFCRNKTPWFLDGSKSSTPNQGLSEAGKPPDKLVAWDWDLHGGSTYTDAHGVQPDVTAVLTPFANGSYLIGLKVTDQTALSFPSSGLGNLSATATGEVTIRAATDPACTCISDLAAIAKSGKVQLTWTGLTAPPAGGYGIMRGTTTGGPYTQVGTVMPSALTLFLDSGLTNGKTYYYVVDPLAANGTSTCQSNQASATPAGR